MVESFEAITSTYAQQLAVNETQSFVTPSLTLVTELVSIRNRYESVASKTIAPDLSYYLLQNTVDSLALDGRSYFIGTIIYRHT